MAAQMLLDKAAGRFGRYQGSDMLAGSQRVHEPNSSGLCSTTVNTRSCRRQVCCGFEKPDNTFFPYKAGQAKSNVLAGPIALVRAKNLKVGKTHLKI